jgi:hypothetical protein
MKKLRVNFPMKLPSTMRSRPEPTRIALSMGTGAPRLDISAMAKRKNRKAMMASWTTS